MTKFQRVLRAPGAGLRRLVVFAIELYRRYVSPALPARCRYYPSCSRYAAAAVTTHGVGKGAALSAWRLLRCNPFSGGGYDPVPERGDWVPSVYPDGRPREGGTWRRRHVSRTPVEPGDRS